MSTYAFNDSVRANRTLLQNARSLRNRSTIGERLLFGHRKLIARQGVYFQYPVSGLERMGYILDIAIPHLRIAIEVDGAYHLEPEQLYKDKLRSEALNLLGWIVLRVDSASCERDPRTIAMAIRETIWSIRNMGGDCFYDGLVSVQWHQNQMPGPKVAQADKPIRIIPSLPERRRL